MGSFVMDQVAKLDAMYLAASAAVAQTGDLLNVISDGTPVSSEQVSLQKTIVSYFTDDDYSSSQSTPSIVESTR